MHQISRLSCSLASTRATMPNSGRSTHFPQCELIMRQAVIKMFALIVCGVIRCGLQYTGEIKAGHAWRKELRRLTISQLPTTVKRAEKYERTVGHGTRQDRPFSLTLFLLCTALRLTLLSPFTPNHVTQPRSNAFYIRDRFKIRKQKKKKAEHWREDGRRISRSCGCCLVSLYKRKTWQGAWQYCKGTL